MLCQVKYLIGHLKIMTDGSDKAIVQCPQSVETLRRPICFYPGVETALIVDSSLVNM